VIEYCDTDSGAHIERMSEYCTAIAARLGWPDAKLERLRLAAAMHDIGKVGVPDEILLEPGALTALTHHERFDGAGYPRGLSGKTIPLAGRTVAVADAFDALTSDRVYRPALPLEEALEVLRDGRGQQFDPDVVDAFEMALDDILLIRDRYSAPVLLRA